MSILIDTHILIWWETANSKLSPRVRDLLEGPDDEIMVSEISFWEMILKAQAGKPIVAGSVAAIWHRQRANGLTILPITIDHILRVEALPMIHKDPFDRLLIAQAIAEGATLVSADRVLGRYPVPVIWGDHP